MSSGHLESQFVFQKGVHQCGGQFVCLCEFEANFRVLSLPQRERCSWCILHETHFCAAHLAHPSIRAWQMEALGEEISHSELMVGTWERRCQVLSLRAHWKQGETRWLTLSDHSNKPRLNLDLSKWLGRILRERVMWCYSEHGLALCGMRTNFRGLGRALWSESLMNSVSKAVKIGSRGANQ